MSEYMEKHSVARLIGAPPGYVGYEEGGHLTEAVRRDPYSVVLMDEIEKAHPDVSTSCCRSWTTGRLTDGKGGRSISLNSVVIMTSNLGTSSTAFSSYEEMQTSVMNAVRAAFKPEFLNRLDDIIVFHPLDEEDVRAIARLRAGDLAVRLRRKGLELRVSDEAIAELARKGFDPVYGARPLKRLIQKSVENRVASAILAGKVGDGDIVSVSFRNGEFHVDSTPSREKPDA